jgi:ribosomal protein S18 acetylase RimI-like enzyme
VISPFAIHEVERADERAGIEIARMEEACFPGRQCYWPAGADSVWWLVRDSDNTPAAYCALGRFSAGPRTGYLSRAGVMPQHRGKGLHPYLIDIRVERARRLGFNTLVTNVNPENVASANNLIEAGFRLYRPGVLWDGEGRLYLRKVLP